MSAFNTKELNLGMQEVFTMHINTLNIISFSTTVQSAIKNT